MPSSTPCAFCGYPAGSEEHVFPRWLSRWLNPDKEAVFSGATRYSRDGEGWTYRESRKQPSKVLSVVTRKLCHSCNVEWFGHQIEARAADLIPQMFEGPVHLHPADLDLLAVWAWKTMLVAHLTGPEEGWPPTFYDEFYLERRPPADVSIVIAHYVDEPRWAEFWSDNTYADARRGLDVMPGFSKMVLVGSVVFHMLQAEGPTPNHVALHHNLIEPALAQTMICAWPPQLRDHPAFHDAAQWPPAVAWSGSAVDNLGYFALRTIGDLRQVNPPSA